MWIHAVYFILGLTGLIVGAEWLVRGSASIATAAGVRPLVIGLTIVALGTSAPELAVSILSAVQGRGDVAIGNVVGSNIANLGLILGVTAVIKPLAMQRSVIIREIPIMIVAAVVAAVMALDGAISQVDGALLILCFFVYNAVMLRTAEKLPGISVEAAVPGASARPPLLKHIGLVLAGLIMLVVAGRLLVDAAVEFAAVLGVSDLVIGLTIVAIGTSLPELATSVLASIRGHGELAIGNVIGSNILNILAILGTTSLIHPLVTRPEIFTLEIPMMLAFSIGILPLAYRGMKLVRWEGAILMVAYGVFLAVLVNRGSV